MAGRRAGRGRDKGAVVIGGGRDRKTCEVERGGCHLSCSFESIVASESIVGLSTLLISLHPIPSLPDVALYTYSRSLLGAAARGLFGIRGLGWSRALLCPRDHRKQAGSHITPPLLVDNCPPQEGRCLAQGPATGRGRPRQVPWVPKRGQRPRATPTPTPAPEAPAPTRPCKPQRAARAAGPRPPCFGAGNARGPTGAQKAAAGAPAWRALAKAGAARA